MVPLVDAMRCELLGGCVIFSLLSKGPQRRGQTCLIFCVGQRDRAHHHLRLASLVARCRLDVFSFQFFLIRTKAEKRDELFFQVTVTNVLMYGMGCGCLFEGPTGLSEERHKIRHKASAIGDCSSKSNWVQIGRDR